MDDTKLKMNLYSHKFNEYEKNLMFNDEIIGEIYSDFTNVTPTSQLLF